MQRPEFVPRPLEVPSPDRTLQLRRWAAILTAATIAWNAVEAVVAIGSGIQANSIALVGFGLDSVLEVASALVIVWLLAAQRRGSAAPELLERRAVRAIAVTFGLVALYVSYESISTLAGFGQEAEPSRAGIVLLALSTVAMPTLAFLKRPIARQLKSPALAADASNTQLCTYLSAAVLVGIGANAALGWWWLDSVAGLVVAGLASREGWIAWRSGEVCEC
ncbi:MAG: hypothetical protein DYG91_05330 [Chloroflexi bacterium CFX7]|nr:hypothetical protein [Chloroflexi bacterium CFX7]RIL01851.1 MAG: hypothetical protein DCC78_09335 [bacterium]